MSILGGQAFTLHSSLEMTVTVQCWGIYLGFEARVMGFLLRIYRATLQIPVFWAEDAENTSVTGHGRERHGRL